MNRAAVTTAGLFLSLIVFACSDERPVPKVNEWDAHRVLGGGPHILRRLKDTEEVHGSVKGSMFLLIGGISGKIDTEWVARFSFRGSDGSWMFSSLPVRKMRVVFDERATVPTIDFRIREAGAPARCQDSSLLSLDCMSTTLEYAILTIRSADFPQDITMPLSGDK